jgi:hypothetical protein
MAASLIQLDPGIAGFRSCRGNANHASREAARGNKELEKRERLMFWSKDNAHPVSRRQVG